MDPFTETGRELAAVEETAAPVLELLSATVQ
jgi:hypothetical protein